MLEEKQFGDVRREIYNMVVEKLYNRISRYENSLNQLSNIFKSGETIKEFDKIKKKNKWN